MAETGLLDAIKDEVRKPGGVCSISLLDLTPADRSALDQALAADKTVYPSTAIAKALDKRGHAVNAYTINRHRRGDCSCRGK
jgi:hypothetical protein